MNDIEEKVETQTTPGKHSKLGISSFILSLVQGVIVFLAIIAAGVAATQSEQSDNESSFIIIGFIIIGGFFAHIVGLGLGIAGLCQKNTKKVFSALGLAFNLMSILGILLLMAIGLAAGS